jgi:hypothetical protein
MVKREVFVEDNSLNYQKLPLAPKLADTRDNAHTD